LLRRLLEPTVPAVLRLLRWKPAAVAVTVRWLRWAAVPTLAKPGTDL
jgi:hypothetical protein